jgi:hypothetical protein
MHAAALLLVLAGADASARVEPPPAPAPFVQAFTLQGGWWSLEAEARSRWGVYLSLGVPWVAAPLSLLSGATWVVPVGGRLGYDLSLGPRWSVRASVHAAVSVSNEVSCGCESNVETRVFGFAELGARYELPSGLVLGADLPVVGIRFPHHGFPPPESLAFSQVYVGYRFF